jgi:hypothetical protein
MKSKYRVSILIAAATIAFAASAQAVDYTWDGGTGNWDATNWNGATASGPTTAGNTATINSGIVTMNVGGVNTVDSITVATGGQLNLDEDIVYNSYGNIVLQGGILNGVNNKMKVIKCMAYGFCDSTYFFEDQVRLPR